MDCLAFVSPFMAAKTQASYADGLVAAAVAAVASV